MPNFATEFGNPFGSPVLFTISRENDDKLMKLSHTTQHGVLHFCFIRSILGGMLLVVPFCVVPLSSSICHVHSIDDTSQSHAEHQFSAA